MVFEGWFNLASPKKRLRNSDLEIQNFWFKRIPKNGSVRRQRAVWKFMQPLCNSSQPDRAAEWLGAENMSTFTDRPGVRKCVNHEPMKFKLNYSINQLKRVHSVHRQVSREMQLVLSLFWVLNFHIFLFGLFIFKLLLTKKVHFQTRRHLDYTFSRLWTELLGHNLSNTVYAQTTMAHALWPVVTQYDPKMPARR